MIWIQGLEQPLTTSMMGTGYIALVQRASLAHVQESTDFAIFNFLEFALGSVIFVDDVSDNNQVDDTNAFTQNNSLDKLQSCVAHHSSHEINTSGEDMEHEIIYDDLSEYPSRVNFTHSTTPEVLHGHLSGECLV